MSDPFDLARAPVHIVHLPDVDPFSFDITQRLDKLILPSWKRGDIIELFELSGYRNDGLFIFDGSKVVSLKSLFDYSHSPPDVPAGDFNALYWSNRIKCNPTVFARFTPQINLLIHDTAKYMTDDFTHIKFLFNDRDWLVIISSGTKLKLPFHRTDVDYFLFISDDDDLLLDRPRFVLDQIQKIRNLPENLHIPPSRTLIRLKHTDCGNYPFLSRHNPSRTPDPKSPLALIVSMSTRTARKNANRKAARAERRKARNEVLSA